MKPEEKARVKIDQMFEDAGWKVVDREFYSPTITAAAIREGLLEGNNEADYFLFINGKAVGVLEAKREEANIASSRVCEQAISLDISWIKEANDDDDMSLTELMATIQQKSDNISKAVVQLQVLLKGIEE